MQLTERMNKMKMWGPCVVRLGMALVFLWFGTQQLMHTTMWISLIPQSIMNLSHLSAEVLVRFNGVFEIVFGLLLLIGFFTRTAALLLALHLLNIMFVVGYNSIGVRDFGLALATFSIFFYGADCCSLDAWLEKRRNVQNTL